MAVTIVVISRLVYRKGIDLLVASAPAICDLFPRVRFVVGGDGPKMVDLLQMREKYELQDRIELVGSVRPADVRDLLTRGHIYLNTSLTEAFGTGIIEAACAGLFVVATRVGGVPEVLPRDMIEFARADEDGECASLASASGYRILLHFPHIPFTSPSPLPAISSSLIPLSSSTAPHPPPVLILPSLTADVIRALTHAISIIQSQAHSPRTAHERVKTMYSWAAVAERTEAVYERVLATPPRSTYERLAAHAAGGVVFGPVLCAIMGVQFWFWWFLELVLPREGIDVVRGSWEGGRFERVSHWQEKRKEGGRGEGRRGRGDERRGRMGWR